MITLRGWTFLGLQVVPLLGILYRGFCSFWGVIPPCLGGRWYNPWELVGRVLVVHPILAHAIAWENLRHMVVSVQGPLLLIKDALVLTV